MPLFALLAGGRQWVAAGVVLVPSDRQHCDKGRGQGALPCSGADDGCLNLTGCTCVSFISVRVYLRDIWRALVRRDANAREALRREERALRAKIAHFTAGERLSRDDAHDRRA